jgi:hypothetical protein
VPSGDESRAGRVRARYRGDDGQFADTTLDRLAVDDIVAGLPVREFRSYKSRLHYPGWYWSSALARLLVYESRLELARVMPADFDPSVTGIAAQPFLLTGTDQGRTRRHVPDLLLGARTAGHGRRCQSAVRVGRSPRARAVRLDPAGVRRAGLGV